MQSKTEQIANALINKTLPKSEWTHHAHLQTGLWHVLHHDAATAMNLMRERIRAYNLCTGVANTDTTGYHETITCFYLIVIRAFTQKCPPDMDIDALAAAGLLIIGSSRIKEQPDGQLSMNKAMLIGAVQGLCLPFRGFSRSGATISTGLMMGVARRKAEEFSFALAVVLTPAVVVKEALRAYKAQVAAAVPHADVLMHIVMPSLVGMVFSFLAGLLALGWLSRWLEQDRWHFFGGYCLVAAVAVYFVG